MREAEAVALREQSPAGARFAQLLPRNQPVRALFFEPDGFRILLANTWVELNESQMLNPAARTATQLRPINGAGDGIFSPISSGVV